jgi:hypothetical protein
LRAIQTELRPNDTENVVKPQLGSNSQAPSPLRMHDFT